MSTLLKATIMALSLMLLAACAKQPATSAADSSQNTPEAQAATDMDRNSDQEYPEGEPAAPTDAADFPERPADALVADEDAADPSQNLLNDESLQDVRFVESATTSHAVAANERYYAQQLADTAAERSAKQAAASTAQESTQSPTEATSVTSAAVAAQAASTPTAPSPTTKETAAPPRPTIDEAKILGDKHGQWAATAKSSSTYASDTSPKAPYSAWQATGAPNVPTYSDHAASWAPKSGDAPVVDWLEVGFAKAVHANSIRVRQNAAPGVISKIELIDDADKMHVVWEGTDTTPYEKNTIGWFTADFPQTAYNVKAARLTLTTNRVWGWNEIDAVQLVGVE